VYEWWKGAGVMRGGVDKGSRGAGGRGAAGELRKAGGMSTRLWLTGLFRRVWESGSVPRDWREGILVPIHKKGDPKECSNYRGITATSVPGKVLERVILGRIRGERDKRTREGQAGFRSGRACADQIFALRELMAGRDQWGLPLVAVALDFSSAYDSVDRDSLWEVLRGEGMGPRTLRVIQAMYRGTSVRVRAGGGESEAFSVDKGVKQGSVLSPVLFVALMDRVLAGALGEGSGCGFFPAVGSVLDLDFADDVLLVGASVGEVQKGVAGVEREGAKYGLRLNPKKTVWVGNRWADRGDLEVGGYRVGRSDSLVYLGVQMDAAGGMAGEVQRRVSVAGGAFWGLKRFWRERGISVKVKARVYVAVVRGAMLYGSETWLLTGREIRALEVAERGFLRYILGVRLRDGLSNRMLMEKVGLSGLGEILTERRWRWLGHVLRMPSVRYPRRVLGWDPDSEEGAFRLPGRPRLTWRAVIMKEGWDSLPFDRLGIRRPHWVHWIRGAWRVILGELAGDRARWRLLVWHLGHVTCAARDSRIGLRS